MVAQVAGASIHENEAMNSVTYLNDRALDRGCSDYDNG